MTDIFLRHGELNPNDVRLLIPNGVAATAPGDLILVDAILLSGQATGIKKHKDDEGGGVALKSFSSPIKLPLSPVRVTTPGQTLKVVASIKPGKARGRAATLGQVVSVQKALIAGTANGRSRVRGRILYGKSPKLVELDNDFLLLAGGFKP